MSDAGASVRTARGERAEVDDAADAAALLAAGYGLAGKLSRLSGESLNYRVETASGERYVLKIAPAEREHTAVDMERQAVRYAADRLVGLRLPRTVTTLSGAAAAELVRGGETLRGQLLAFVPGTPWRRAGPHGGALLRCLGATLARLDLALAGFEHPSMHRSHRWDLAALSQHRAKVALVSDGARRRVLEWAFHLWAAQALPRLGDLPHSFIHGDANDENLLVDDGRVVGLVDFGDSLYNPTVCELAIALSYVMASAPDPLAAGAGVVAAYTAVRPLSPAELEVLFPLICGRLANTVSVAAERRREDPDHPNWFVSEAGAWALLRRCHRIAPVDALSALASGVEGWSPSPRGAPPEELLARRKRLIGPSLSLSYTRPIKVLKGRGQYLFDYEGRPYLDLVNNICHVGHCHPRVVAAGQRQMGLLNTNTRYLFDGLTDYAERLCSTLPAPLSVCFFVNSGSEANELALRLARAHTARRDVIVVDGAYHGNTSQLVGISPYKFMGKGGAGRAEPWVHTVPIADGYRGAHKGQGTEAGKAYGDAVGTVIDRVGDRVAAFLTEPVWSCGGQVVPPAGYLEAAFGHARRAGAVCIADEVQVGFGRVGRAFWGFELQGVVPDIVVMGKPIGNGHPMGAVVTTPEIAASFDNGMEYFNSFGGNPVSCAIGMAVLDVMEDECLEDHALRMGSHFLAGLEELSRRHPVVGDVRGEGLFIGAELVDDRDSLAPATGTASLVVNRMKDRGVLLSTDGPLENVLKIKPPLVLTSADIDMALRCLDDVLTELGC